MNTQAMRVFTFGAGYTGAFHGGQLAARGVTVHGTTRTQDKAESLAAAGIVPHVFDGGPASAAMWEALEATTHLIVSVGPDETGDPVLGALREDIAVMPRLQWIGYLSTVGVYGDHEGEWVSEETECRPASRRSVRRVGAERDWTSFAAGIGKPLSILRLSGIYGPGRNAFVNLDAGSARRIIKPGQVFNRIHVEDIAGALDLLAAQLADGIYNVTDDEPAPPQDVVEYAAALMKVDPPPAVDFDSATISPMARSFYGERKRVTNAKLKGAGYTLAHRDYRSGLSALWNSGKWR